MIVYYYLLILEMVVNTASTHADYYRRRYRKTEVNKAEENLRVNDITSYEIFRIAIGQDRCSKNIMRTNARFISARSFEEIEKLRCPRMITFLRRVQVEFLDSTRDYFRWNYYIPIKRINRCNFM